MQTFLPFPDFTESARVLDRMRLGKQRVETMQIMRALLENTGWVNHPATKMWRGHEGTLLQYQWAVTQEWCGRGYADTCNGLQRAHRQRTHLCEGLPQLPLARAVKHQTFVHHAFKNVDPTTDRHVKELIVECCACTWVAPGFTRRPEAKAAGEQHETENHTIERNPL